MGKNEPTPSEYLSRLHENADIRVWIKDHRNPHTARLQFEQLALFCRRTASSPEDLVRLAAAKPNTEFRALVLDWAEAQRAQGRPDQYLKAIWYAVKSWLKHNEVRPSWSPPFNVLPAATLGAERVPTVEEVRKLLSVISPRNRVAVLILTSSGVRIGALADRFEAGGITLADFPDLVLSRGGPKFGSTPPVLHVPANRAKGWKEYYTFISGEAAEALQAYLTERIRRKEKLGPGSSVIGPEPKASHSHFRRSREGSLFISGKSLGNAIRVGLRKTLPKGVRVRPHTLRSWTSTNLERAEREGQITRTLREYFMGHALKSIDTRYNVGKRLSGDQIEELRKAYARVERFVSTSPQRTEALAVDPVYRKAVLFAVGYTDADTKEMDLAGMPNEEFLEAIQNSPARKHSASSGPREMVVTEAELPKYLADGWLAKMPVNGSKFVIERENP